MSDRPMARMGSRHTFVQQSRSNTTVPCVHFPKDIDDKETTEHVTEDQHTHPSQHRQSHFCDLFYDRHRPEVHEAPELDPADVRHYRPIPATVVPLHQKRLVLLKVADSFLRIGSGSTPIVSKVRPPLHQPVEDNALSELLNCQSWGRRERSKRRCWNVDFKDFTFLLDETASITESWYRHARAFFHIRLAVSRDEKRDPKAEEEMEYLCIMKGPNERYEVQFDKNTFGSWWRITAVSSDRYVAESVRYPGRCLTKGRFGLCLSPPLSDRERGNIFRGKWNKERTITIITLPDFAVWHPSVYVH